MRIFDQILDFIFPPRCIACGKLIAQGEACTECSDALAHLMAMPCPDCKRSHLFCTCRVQAPKEMRALFPIIPDEGLFQMHLYPYRSGNIGRAERLVLLAKERELCTFSRFIEKEAISFFAPRMEGENAIVTFVPRAPRKVRVTGSDQAKQIAKGVARGADLPMIPLLWARDGREQKKKKGNERFENITARYRLKGGAQARVRGKTVYLCDDILTSGATALACASLLLEAGAKRVFVIAVCRTVCEGNQEESL